MPFANDTQDHSTQVTHSTQHTHQRGSHKSCTVDTCTSLIEGGRVERHHLGHSAHTAQCTNVCKQAAQRAHEISRQARVFPLRPAETSSLGPGLRSPRRQGEGERIATCAPVATRASVSGCHPHCSRGRGALHPQGGHRGGRRLGHQGAELCNVVSNLSMLDVEKWVGE